MRPNRRFHSGWRATVVVTAMVLTASASDVGVAAQDEDDLTIPLNEYKESGVSGSATLSADGEGTMVAMEIAGARVSGDHPTHIHTGTCDNFDPDPTYPLTTVILDEVSEEGVSETEVEDVSLRELLADDYVILIHKSAEELTNYFVCGDIKRTADDEGGAENGNGGDDRNRATAEDEGAAENGNDGEATNGATGVGGASRMPRTGIGATAERVGSPLPGVAAALAVLSVLSCAGALLAYRRRA